MKYSFTTAGLMVLVYGSAVTVAAALPLERTPANDVHIIEVQRDWDGMRANMARKAAQKDSSQKRQSDGPYNLDYANYWFANITAGGQPASVLLDTGSADLWLVNPSAGSDATSGVQTWDPTTAQDTTQMNGETFNIGYGEGGNGVSGNVYQTNVCVGSACTTMAVGSATTDQGLGNFPRSGIMGMAFQGGNSVSPDKQKTFMESLEGSLSSPIFVTKFTPEGSTSQIAFGSNPFSFVAPMQEIQVDSSSTAKYPYSWSYTGVQYSKNGQSLGTFDVVFDSGGPMTSAAEDIVRGYYNGVSGATDVNGDASSWTVPCGTQLPDLTLTLGSATLVIPGEKFYNGNTDTSGNCTVWFVKENSPTRGVIGDPFFCQHVVVFNQQASTISWGNQS